MTLFFDLDLGRFVSAPGFRDRLRNIEFKRGDAALITLGFYRGITQVILTGTPQLTLAIKEAGKYDGDPLVSTSTWTLGTTEAKNYSCSPNFNTAALNALLMVDEDEDNDPASITAMLEVTWSEDSGTTWTSSDTIAAKIHNDVIRGDEGTPVELPTPESWLYARQAALTFAGSDPNSVLTVVFAGGTYVLNRNGSVNGRPYFEGDDGSLMAWFGTYWRFNPDGSSDNSDSSDDVASPELATTWSIAIDVTLDLLSSTHLGQWCRVETADANVYDWWQWNGDEWVFVRTDDVSPVTAINVAAVLPAAITEAGAAEVRAAAAATSQSDYEAAVRRLDAVTLSLMDPEAAIYQIATGIGLDAAVQISTFFQGLDAIGVRSSFVDGYALAGRFQPPAAATLYSIRGNANLALTGSPTRHRNGLLFTNDHYATPSSPQRAIGDFPAMVGEWTVMSSTFRDIDSPTNDFRRAYIAYTGNNVSGVSELQSALNWTISSRAGSSSANLAGNTGGHAVSESRYDPVQIRNATSIAADSFKIRLTRPEPDYEAATTGKGNCAFSRMLIGVGSDNDGSTFVGYFDGMVSYLLVWDALLTDAQLKAVERLVNRTLMPRVSWIFDGDSISTNQNGWASYFRAASEWLGRNITLAEIGVGGETSVGVAGRIGKQGIRMLFSGQPTNAQSFVVNGRIYTYKTTLAAPDDILIGGTSGATLNNTLAAINGAAGEGTLYGTGTTANADVSALFTISSILYLLRDSSLPAITITESLSNVGLYTMDGIAITSTVPMGICAELRNVSHPTWYLCNVGHNDREDTPTWQDSLTNIRAAWAAARAEGIKVVACTVTGADSFLSGYWYGGAGDLGEDARQALNAAIRADSDNYDALLDVDGILTTRYGATYWDNTAVLQDGVHPSPATRREIMNDMWDLIGGEMP